MSVIIIPNLEIAPVIDVVSPDDFFLIGDASDSGKIKRAFIESLPNSSDDKLPIDDYSFDKIPDKPLTFPHNPIEWGELENKPLTFDPTLSPYANLTTADLTVNPDNPDTYFYQMESNGEYIADTQGIWDFRLPENPAIGDTIDFQAVFGNGMISSAAGRINFYNKSSGLQLVRDVNNKYYAQIDANPPLPITNQGVQIFANIYPNYQILAIAVIESANKAFWRNIQLNVISLWSLDNAWQFVSSVEGNLITSSIATYYEELFQTSLYQEQEIAYISTVNVLYSRLRMKNLSAISLIYTGLYWVVRYRIGSIVPLV